jgi:hypothetical protein
VDRKFILQILLDDLLTLNIPIAEYYKNAELREC